jgi:hypothetical protein
VLVVHSQNILHINDLEYIQAIHLWRNIAEEPEIESINDIRNGILVDAGAHRYLDVPRLAVLRVSLRRFSRLSKYSLAVDSQFRSEYG